jgi:ornithine carbamoyltransferase
MNALGGGAVLQQWKGRSLLKEQECDAEEFIALVAYAAALKADRRAGTEQPRLIGKTIALIFEKTSTRTRAAFEVAAAHQGAHTTYLSPDGTQIGHKESIADTARVLGRMYDGIQFRGHSQEAVEELARFAGVPVWNGLTDRFHPTQMLADVLTMREHSTKPLNAIAHTYVGDARNNMGNSTLITGALLGMDVRLLAPASLQPEQSIIATAQALAARSGATVTVTDDADTALKGADFVSTDVWVSMGEPDEVWAERVSVLKPYRVDEKLLARTGNPDTAVMHCLPAYHDRRTAVGEKVHQRFGLDGVEISHSVFEANASVIFEQSENRMHTIKALMVASLNPPLD